MGYFVGIDLGTTFTAAAINRDGTVEIVSLGRHTSVHPDPGLRPGRRRDAHRRGRGPAGHRPSPPGWPASSSGGSGDSAPIMLGGVRRTRPSALTAAVLAGLVDHGREREGGPPDRVALTYPANWGPFKVDVLRRRGRLAGPADAVTAHRARTAAAVHYASTERIASATSSPSTTSAAARSTPPCCASTPTAWSMLGTPEGIEHLGGVDFDEAVFDHVRDALGAAARGARPERPGGSRRDRPPAPATASRPRRRSPSDAEATIPVMLPGLQTEVRLTRAEFEAMIRPTVRDTIDALRRALALGRGRARRPARRAAGRRLVPHPAGRRDGRRTSLGRPVAVDAHPKHAVALGAARMVAAFGAAAVRRRAGARRHGRRGRCRGRSRAGAGTAGPPSGPTATVGAGGTPPRRGDGRGGGNGPSVGGPAKPRKPKRKHESTLLVVLGIIVLALAAGAVIIATSGGGDSSSGASTSTTGATATTGSTRRPRSARRSRAVAPSSRASPSTRARRPTSPPTR